MTIRHRGLFHSVGQGLFHSAAISHDNIPGPRFNYVYDCGGYAHHTKRCVDAFVQSLSGRPVNLLILSHLHRDHVNGLNYLLGYHRVTVDRVILPYLYPLERAVCMADAVDDSYYAANPEEWYSRFLLSPSDYLIGTGRVRHVTYIVGGGPDRDPRRGTESSQDTFDDSGGAEWTGPSHLSDDDSAAIQEAEDTWVGPEGAMQAGVEFRDASASLAIPTWQFTFFQRQRDRAVLNDLVDRIKTVTGKLMLRHLLRRKAKRDRIKKEYEAIFGKDGLNDTSVAVFSHSAPSPQSIWYFLYGPYPQSRNRRVPWPPWKRPTPAVETTGVLLTGDLGLKRPRTVWDDMALRFGIGPGGTRAEAAVVQIPHHGSRENWHDGLAELGLHCPMHIVSAGPKGRHPHPDVEAALRKRDRVIVRVNEQDECHYVLNCHTTR